MKLYELSEQLAKAMESIINAEGEVTTEVAETLETTEANFRAKVHNICAMIRNLEAEADRINAVRVTFLEEAKRLGAQVSKRNRAVESLQDYIKTCMEHAGERRVETPLFTAYIQDNSVPIIAWEGEYGDIPTQYLLPPSPPPVNRELILSLYKSGDLPPGFSVRTGNHLRIK